MWPVIDRFSRPFVAISVLLIAVAPLQLCAQPAIPSASIAELDEFISKAVAQYGVPGAAVAVVQNGKIVLIKGYGVRNNTQPGAVDGNTIFQIASISKAFTGALAATMVDDGKLSWDTPIINYLPEFVDFDPYITRWMTMRDLLAHRTGWPKFSGDILNTLGYSRPEVLRRLRYLQPIVTFRQEAQYSNPGFFVAGEVEARVGGASWNALLKQRIIDPLHMTRTGTSVHDLSDPNSAIGHENMNGRTVPTAANDQDVMGAAGSVTSTVTDLTHFMQALLGNGNDGKLLKRDTVAEMFARSMVGEIEFTEMPPTTKRTGFFYGLGFDSIDYAGHQIVGKAGALAGVRTMMTLVPDKNSGIVILANLNVTALPEAIRAFYVERLLGNSPEADLTDIAARNEKLPMLFTPPAPPVQPGPFGYPLASVVGIYENDLFGRCEIATDGPGLHMSCGPAHLVAPLRHFDNGQFIRHWAGATNGYDAVTFSIGAAGNADSFTDESLGRFTRLRVSK